MVHSSYLLLLFQVFLMVLTFWFARAADFHDMTFLLTLGWAFLSSIVALAMLSVQRVAH